MKRVLFTLLFASVLFSCKKNEAPAPKKSFDETLLVKKIDEISAAAVAKSQSHMGAKGFWKILKIIGSDIVGGVSGALQGMSLTGGSTAGGVIGGVAGAASASIKAAESYSVTADATSTLHMNLGRAPVLNTSQHVPADLQVANPFNYYGVFHNLHLANLTPKVDYSGSVLTGGAGTIVFNDDFNQGYLSQALRADSYFGGYMESLDEEGYPYSLAQYQSATRYITPNAYSTDNAYYTMLVNSTSSFGPISTTSKTLLLTFFKTVEQLETIEEVEDYVYQYVLTVDSFGSDYPDHDVLMQSMAIAAYSFDFWYTLNTVN